MTYMVTYVTCQTKKLTFHEATSAVDLSWASRRGPPGPTPNATFAPLTLPKPVRYGRSVSCKFNEVTDA
jgi:hypothetical protein